MQDYAAAVQSFDWADFYASYDGEAYFDWMRDELETMADVVLIDSRTGVTEMGGVCTRHLADVVVSLCAPNRQNLQGLVDMLRSFRRTSLIAARGRPLELMVVPTRIENSEITLLNAFATEFTKRLDEFTPETFRRSQRTFWELRVPYVPRYAYAEALVVGASDTSVDLERAYKALTAHMLMLAPAMLVDRAGSDLASDVRALSPGEPQHSVGHIFVSYARSDGAAVARIVEDRLKRQVPDMPFWMETESLVSGVNWSAQIEAAVLAAHSMLVVVTPAGGDVSVTEASRVLDGRLSRQRGECGHQLQPPLPERQSSDAARPQSGRQCRGEGQGNNLRCRIPSARPSPRSCPGNRRHHPPVVSIDLEDPARARALRRTGAGRQRGSQEGPRAKDDPGTPRPRLPRRARGTIFDGLSDFRPWLVTAA
jgi:hypothetical protein